MDKILDSMEMRRHYDPKIDELVADMHSKGLISMRDATYSNKREELMILIRSFANAVRCEPKERPIARLRPRMLVQNTIHALEKYETPQEKEECLRGMAILVINGVYEAKDFE